ncbi:MAG: hypothetical protein EOP83_02150 [Verrucomicrobiaceae bacterium]|nr:MAG: hypothetical protein EOP83_02150 [Verrucomicrobiaceae bacterium]
MTAEWTAPQVADKGEITLAEYQEVLEELRTAASSVYSELSGTTMHLRGARRLDELREPMRRAWCLLNGVAYVPSSDPPKDPTAMIVQAILEGQK